MRSGLLLQRVLNSRDVQLESCDALECALAGNGARCRCCDKELFLLIAQ